SASLARALRTRLSVRVVVIEDLPSSSGHRDQAAVGHATCAVHHLVVARAPELRLLAREREHVGDHRSTAARHAVAHAPPAHPLALTLEDAMLDQLGDPARRAG